MLTEEENKIRKRKKIKETSERIIKRAVRGGEGEVERKVDKGKETCERKGWRSNIRGQGRGCKSKRGTTKMRWKELGQEREKMRWRRGLIRRVK